ncbi:MAG: ribosomal-processing cysteine protease Prp [Ignavibacteriales bacterium]
MIKVKINKDNDKIIAIDITGHSNYDEYGKDIVCAAVSSIVITTVNAIMKIDKECINFIQSDDLNIKVIKHTETTDILINNMIDLLIELEEQYEENVKVEN